MRIYIVFENIIAKFDVQNKKFWPILKNINKIKTYIEKNPNNKICIWSSLDKIPPIINFLDKWSIKYDLIKLGKPKFNLLIDDNTINTI